MHVYLSTHICTHILTNTDYDPDEETTDVEQSSDEEEGPAKVVVTFLSKNGSLWFVLHHHLSGEVDCRLKMT